MIAPSSVFRTACLIVAVAVGSATCGSNSGPGPTPITPPPPPPPNEAPVIRSVEVQDLRLEVGDSTTLRAVVEDAETLPDRLQYQWTADAGTFSGEGPEVTWQAPLQATGPMSYVLTLTVVETYTLNGVEQTNRTSLGSAVRVHHSERELEDLAETFMEDFTDSSVSPERCVRNFSDSCAGKEREQEDIERNRSDLTMLPSKYSVREVDIVTPWANANIRVACEFHAKRKLTGKTETATGTCSLTAIYEQDRWWLCDSSFRGTVTNPSLRIF